MAGPVNNHLDAALQPINSSAKETEQVTIDVVMAIPTSSQGSSHTATAIPISSNLAILELK